VRPTGDSQHSRKVGSLSAGTELEVSSGWWSLGFAAVQQFLSIPPRPAAEHFLTAKTTASQSRRHPLLHTLKSFYISSTKR